MENGHAQEIAESCIICGRCVEICPVGAKRIRDDLTPVRELLRSGRPVYASIAPSWVGEFDGVAPSQIIQAIKALGFRNVGETALGAQEVSASLASFLRDAKPGLYLSTACPSAVEYVRRYLPHLTRCLTPVMSPLLAHCKILREHMEPDGAVVFFGPCIAKKEEADTHRDLLEGALTFKDLRQWMEEETVDPLSFGEKSAQFFPKKAEEGNHYPVEGGMIDTIKASGDFSHIRFSYRLWNILHQKGPGQRRSRPFFIAGFHGVPHLRRGLYKRTGLVERQRRTLKVDGRKGLRRTVGEGSRKKRGRSRWLSSTTPEFPG